MLYRLFLFVTLVLCTALSLGQRTITVSSPIKDDYLGKSNKVQFSIDGAFFQVTVKVVATYLATNQKVTVQGQFTPNSNHQINDSIALNFGDSAPQGAWKIEVTPTEKDSDGIPFVYTPSSVTINVNVDVKAPSFYTVNPLDNAYVKGTVHINATLNELNVDTWTVKINNGDIPNNSGDTKTVDVDWDTTGVKKDGTQAVLIEVKDKAKNSTSRSFSLIIDRVAPSSQILTPGPDTPLPPNTNIIVQVNVTDQFSDSVDFTGIDVVAKTLDNKFITRVSRRGLNSNGTTLNWSGRIRWQNSLPKEFKIVVTAIDKAGNVATVQETRVKVGNR